MKLTEEKLKILRNMNSDYADLVIKLNEYLNEEYTLSMNPKVFEKIETSIVQEALNLIFTSKENKNILQFQINQNSKSKSDTHHQKELENNIYFFNEHPNIIDEQNGTILESAYYSRKIFNKKISIKPFEQEVLETLNAIKEQENMKVIVILDLNSISSYPIWNTKMRRKSEAIIEEISNINLSNVIESDLKKILHNVKPQNPPKPSNFDLDYVLNVLKELSEINKFEIRFVATSLTNEKIYLINEINKYITAIKKEDRLEYIYDAICQNMDDMFGKYNFCNFKNDKCFSQRHKGIGNNYPVPNKDGCCFKTFRKCGYNNKDGTCKVKCVSCKLFICPYLSGFVAGVMLSEIIFARNLLSTKQKKKFIFSFFKPKNKII